MAIVSENVKRLIQKEGLFVVGTSDKKGISNLSPRTAYFLSTSGEIYWLELFKHKTYHNIKSNPWCSIAVFDKRRLGGYQIKGTAGLVKDKKSKEDITVRIIDRLTRQHKQRIIKATKKPGLVRFTPKILYSLNPNEMASAPLEMKATKESLSASNMD